MPFETDPEFEERMKGAVWPEDELSRLRAENERLRNNTNRFPELMGKITAEKATGLSERVSAVLSAIKAMPDGFGNYQWEADEKHLFGDKWVRSVAGNDGLGMGRQAIAATPNHLTGVAQYIAAANPDTVLMLMAENERLTAELARVTSPEYLTEALTKIGVCDIEWQDRALAAEAREAKAVEELRLLKEGKDV